MSEVGCGPWPEHGNVARSGRLGIDNINHLHREQIQLT